MPVLRRCRPKAKIRPPAENRRAVFQKLNDHHIGEPIALCHPGQVLQKRLGGLLKAFVLLPDPHGPVADDLVPGIQTTRVLQKPAHVPYGPFAVEEFGHHHGADLGQLAVFQEEMAQNTDLIAPVTSYPQILTNESQEKMSALLTLEEGEVCGGSLTRLQEIYSMGIRMMTFTWNYPNSLGYPAEPAPFTALIKPFTGCEDNTSLLSLKNAYQTAYSRTEKGLTSLGIEFLAEMERLGIIPDVSHLSDEGIRDVCRFATKPFCVSHSNARSLCGRGRNLPDNLIRAISEKGGIIGVNFYGPFLSDTPNGHDIFFSYIKNIAQHICHISDIGGNFRVPSCRKPTSALLGCSFTNFSIIHISSLEKLIFFSKFNSTS